MADKPIPPPATPGAVPSGTSPSAATPSASALRRALRRVRDGAALDVTEAAVLLAARGRTARRAARPPPARVRDAGLVDAGRPGVVTYSRKVFIPLTRLCRDRCHYCTFATVPHRLPAAFLERDEVLEIARAGAAAGLQGGAVHPRRPARRSAGPPPREWLEARGYDSTLDYVRACAIAVLEETGLLPHLNPGVMSWEELTRLKPVAPSMGMMLETTATRLWSEPGGPHYGSPDKEPAVRLRTLTDAGRVGVPFTTGILIGIGENARRAGRVALRDPGGGPGARARPGGDRPELPGQARHRDGERPGRRPRRPRRHDRRRPAGARAEDAAAGAAEPRRRGVRADARAPASTTGAASRRSRPTTSTPSGPGPPSTSCAARSAEAGFTLRERLTAYPQYVLAGLAVDRHPAARARRARSPTRDRAGRRGRRAGGPAVAGARRRVRLHRPDRPAHGASTPTGRTDDRRGDFASVYGDWDALREELDATRQGRRPQRLDADVRAGARARRVRPGRPARPGAPRRRAGAAPRRGPRAGGAGPARRRRAPRRRRRRGHLRRQPQHQLLERLLRRLPVLRVRPARARRRRVPAVARRGRRPGRRGGAGAAPPRSACRAASTRSCRSRSTRTSCGRCRPPCRTCTCTRSRPMEIVSAAAKAGRLDRGVAHRAARRRARLDPRHRGGDPRRRGPLGAHQGQAAGRAVGRGRDDRARAGHPVVARR